MVMCISRIARPQFGLRCFHTTTRRSNLDAILPKASRQWPQMPSSAKISEDEVTRLAALPRLPLTLADLVR